MEENRCEICWAYMECKAESTTEADTDPGYYYQCNNKNHYKHKEYNKEMKEKYPDWIWR